MSAVNAVTGERCRVISSNDKGGVYVQYTTGWMAGRRTWHRAKDLIFIS